MATEIRLLVADDHPIVRQGLRNAIEADINLKIVAEAGDGQTALSDIQSLRPDIAILDIDMPKMDGFAVARTLRSQKFPVEIIFLTVHCEEEFLNEALSLDAKGYVLKDSAITDIVSSIHTVAEGKHYISPTLTSILVNRNRNKSSEAATKTGLSNLSPTEQQVVKLIAEYKTTKEIAEALFISPHTVQTHRKNICAKLGLEGSHALMRYALEQK
ncbi:MAG TPA: response regulator transcription factor [Blastocatellia bacterium]|nr:response regulator transcription factor [Blastocatellia bacterium]